MWVIISRAERLQFFGKHGALTNARAFATYLAPLRNSKWVVYSERPFGGPEEVLHYLARYTHRVATSNRRLVALDDNCVTLKWKDYRIAGPGRYKLMTLDPHELNLIEAAGVSLLYLAPYSPDFNPIENAFAKLKALLRKAAERTLDRLWHAIGCIIDCFSQAECKNYLAAAGYVAT